MKHSNAPILKAINLTFNYPHQELFNNLSVEIPAGITLVRGGDGRGKSSLLRLLAGDLPAQAGELQINGVSLNEQPDLYRRQVFWVDPRSEAFDQMTAHEYFASLHATYPKFDDSLLPALTEGLSLTPHLDKKLYMLSTGSKRKVWLAAAFAAGATLNLLDDPFASLDKASINFVVKMLNRVAGNSPQAWVIALYDAVDGVPFTTTIDLGD
ncbi:ABC transporter family protein [Collimonas arenae]|uniref:ABC transporter family protein n=1 Tax=Collimonas arenae TaxID=279058 RepID=A0A127QDC6_9BURK|nr:ATP-binding cassette domain-containing protein [Collimonas arenae]AMO97973.1 ABC transporter family protein [Collimonas arenae]AMP07835.1 ABC transporter family protein [Collimonas arenae]